MARAITLRHHTVPCLEFRMVVLVIHQDTTKRVISFRARVTGTLHSHLEVLAVVGCRAVCEGRGGASSRLALLLYVLLGMT